VTARGRAAVPTGLTVVPPGLTITPPRLTVVAAGPTVVPAGLTVVPGSPTVVPAGLTVVLAGPTVMPAGPEVVPDPIPDLVPAQVRAVPAMPEPVGPPTAGRRDVRRHRGGARYRHRRRRRRDRGSAAIEVALALPVIVLFFGCVAVSYTALFAKVRCVDAAGTAVRAAARGEPVPDVGRGADVAVERDGDLVRVTVRMRVPAPMLSGLTVEERAVAMAEPQSATGP
jgi:hypothetical protein